MEPNSHTEKSNIDSARSDINISASEKSQQLVHKDQQSDKQDITSREEVHNDFVEEKTIVGDAYCRQDSTCDPVYNVQDMQMPPNDNCRNVEIQSSEEEPLDYTADISRAQPTKHEPLDYTLDVDSETGYKTYLSNESLYKPEESLRRKGINSIILI